MTTDVDTHLANLPALQRDTLQSLRTVLKSPLPDALVLRIIAARQAELATAYGKH
jgi:hypothetical protein